MGSLIVADPWLLYASMDRPDAAPTLLRILRAQVSVGHRTGHVFLLTSDLSRTAVQHAARRGHVPNVIASCVRCNRPALLPQWLSVGEMSREAFEATVKRLDDTEAVPEEAWMLMQCRYQGNLAELIELATGEWGR